MYKPQTVSTYKQCLNYLQTDYESLIVQPFNPALNWLEQHVLIHSWILQVQLSGGVVRRDQVVALTGGDNYAQKVDFILSSAFKKAGFYELHDNETPIKTFALSEQMIRALEHFYGSSGKGPTYLLNEPVPYFPDNMRGGDIIAGMYQLRKGRVDEDVFRAFDELFAGKLTFSIPFEVIPHVRVVSHPSYGWSFVLGVFPGSTVVDRSEVRRIVEEWSAVIRRVDDERSREGKGSIRHSILVTTFNDDEAISKVHEYFPDIRWMSVFSAIRFFSDVHDLIADCQEAATQTFMACFEEQNPKPALSVRAALERWDKAIRTICPEHKAYKHGNLIVSNGLVESDTEEVSPEEVAIAFDSIRQLVSAGDNRAGRKPMRIERIRQVMLDRETEAIPIEEFELAFENTEHPRRSAANAISDLNSQLRELKLELELKGETVTVSGHSKRVYKFQRVTD